MVRRVKLCALQRHQPTPGEPASRTSSVSRAAARGHALRLRTARVIGQCLSRPGRSARVARVDRLSLSLGAYISGAVIGERVAVGDYTVQVHPEHGAVVKQAKPEQRVAPRPRAQPKGHDTGDLPAILGRDELLRILAGALASGTPVEVVGEAGIGKTTLLTGLARQRGES